MLLLTNILRNWKLIRFSIDKKEECSNEIYKMKVIYANKSRNGKELQNLIFHGGPTNILLLSSLLHFPRSLEYFFVLFSLFHTFLLFSSNRILLGVLVKVLFILEMYSYDIGFTMHRIITKSKTGQSPLKMVLLTQRWLKICTFLRNWSW